MSAAVTLKARSFLGSLRKFRNFDPIIVHKPTVGTVTAPNTRAMMKRPSTGFVFGVYAETAESAVAQALGFTY
jgi:hypothetical protein